MVNTLRRSNVFRLGKRQSTPSEPQTQPTQQQEALVTLVRELQSSLELESILNLFFEEICKLVPVEGLGYGHEELNIEFSTKSQGRHKITYQLTTEDETLGEIAFTRMDRFKEPDLAILESMMSCLLYPLRNALEYQRALKAATTDPLTGICNRQAMDACLDREIMLSKRDGIPLSILMFDLDHFKQVNDNHGHQCGDHVLREIASIVRDSLRKTDLIFRYGGEEFLIALHKTTPEGARIVAEKVRELVAQALITYKDTKLDITLSLGVASLKQDDVADTLIGRVDRALYQAKLNGRDQVWQAIQHSPSSTVLDSI